MINGRWQRKLKWNKANYKELSCFKMPRLCDKKPIKVTEQLYAVDVLEKNMAVLKLHYVAYEDRFDEWGDEAELEMLDQEAEETQPSVEQPKVFETYSFYKDLGIKVKKALSCSRTASPIIKIVMPFDVLLFNGGLKSSGIPSKKVAGNQQYKIVHYKDLNQLLGCKRD